MQGGSQIYRDKAQSPMKDRGMNPDSNFRNGNNVRTPNQFRKDRDNPSIFKAHFPSRKD